MNNHTKRDRQTTTRLALIAIPLLGSIVFALSSLVGKLLDNETWQILMQVASGFMGALGLLAGSVTLVFQMTRRQVDFRNVVVFGCLYMLAIFVFLSSCVVLIES
jgi:hypothetical protein